MFEKLVESLLEEYVSEWVDGLDADKMKVAVFSGKVEFRDLTLKASALDKFQFPLRVKAGTLGRLTMKVPWKRLTTQAVTMQIHDLFLVVVPSHQEDLNRSKRQPQQRLEDMVADSYELRLRWAKQQAVRVRELVETNKNEETQRNADSSDAAGTWGLREKILHNIVDNVSFEFTNIHIRYEDTSLLIAQNPLALGLTIESITVQTTNANGHVTFIDRSQSHTPFVHKSLEMVKAGLYCDNTSSMQNLISVRRREPLASSYLVHPFNTTIKMTVNHDESTVFSIPRYQFIADISSVTASVTPEQCNDLINIVNYVSTHELYLKRIHCRRKRPRVPIRHNARAWWKYAMYGVQVMYSLQTSLFPSAEKGSSISPTESHKIRRCNWKLFTSLWFRRKEYIRLHKKQIQASTKKITAGEGNSPDRLRLNELEDELDVDTIVFFRICAAQEQELEESRHDSVKKLSNWKARWSARGHSSQTDTSPGHRRLDPLEKLLLYSTISEQMHESASELEMKKLEGLNSETILFAIDIVVSSVTLALVEKQGSMASAVSPSSSASTRDFVCFELQQFVFAIFQRATACTIASSIKSVQMVDFSHDINGDDRQPQVLFYALPAGPDTESCVEGQLREGGSAVVDQQKSTKFVQLTIDSSETKFKLDCNFESFRYIHNVTVATKLQAYFITQVDVSPALKENAEEAFAYSSIWINRAVFANNGSNKPNSIDTNGKGKKHSSNVIKPRIIEFSVRLPEVDLLVLSSEVSPVLEATLQDLHFKSGNLLDTFVFSVDGVEILFHDRILPEDMVAETQTRSNSGKRVLQHQRALREVNAGAIPIVHVVPRGYDLSRRNHSTILRKTRIEFLGEKIIQRNRVPKWLMRCTAPPIYFTLSSAQYHQVLQASASWANSNQVGSPLSTALPETVSTNADSSSAPKLSKSEPPVGKTMKLAEFDPDDERFGLSILIPQILVVLEGGNGTNEFAANCETTKTINNDNLEIDLVLDIKQVNVEARFTSVAQAVALDLRSLTFFKQDWNQKTTDRDPTSKVRMTTQQALAKANEEQSSGTPPSKSKNDSLDEPEPAYDATTGKATCKLLEICSKASFVITSVDPFKAKIYAQRVSLYWDYDLLVALFRSYLLGNAAFTTSDSSANSSRTNSGDSVDSNVTVASAIADALEQQLAAPFGIELQVDRWYIYMLPQSTFSPRFTLKMYGRSLHGNISTLDSSYLRLQFNAKGGVNLDSSCLMSRGIDDQGHPVAGEEACDLLSVLSPLKVEVESAGYGGLEHRGGAGAYVKICGSNIEVNYANAHYMVLADHMAKQFIGFFSWVSVQMKPAQILTLNERTKIDAEINDIRLFLPRGAVGNATERQKKPERVEIDVKKVSINSRMYPNYIGSEQLQILVENIQISTCLVDSLIRPHLNAVSSVDEAVSIGKSRHSVWVRTHEIEMAKSRIFHHEYLYIEYVAVPIPPNKQKKRDLPRRKSQKVNEVMDIEDVMKELEKICGYVRVSLSKPTGWGDAGKADDRNMHLIGNGLKDKNALGAKKTRELVIETSASLKSVEVALDEKQLELLACILDENLARSELVNTTKSIPDNEKENKALDVQVYVGNISVQLLRTNIHPLGCSKTSRYPYERIITQLDFENVRLLITGFSTKRAQYRVLSSKATLYIVDVIHTPNHDDASEITQATKKLTTCAEIYLSSEDENCECIDVTVDQYPAVAGGPANPVDIRIHVDTCALSPPIIQFALRVKEFLFCKVQLANYISQPGQPVNLSVTTGAVHCMLAEFYPSRDTFQSSSGGRMSTASDNFNDTSLKLILSGCFVVRFNNGEQHLQHIQIFGRKMSIEVAAQWPPLAESDLGKSPSSPSRQLTEFAGEQFFGRHSSSVVQNLSDYRRVLCEDFAVDLDLIDTTQSDNVMKISASLTHFHAVLCVFDVFMLTRIGENKWTDGYYDSSGINYDDHLDYCTCARHAAIVEVTRGDLHRRKTAMTIVNTMLEDFSVTFVREIGEYFTPVARMYSFCTMCNVTITVPVVDVTPNPALPDEGKSSSTVSVFLHFSEDSATELRDDEGMSIWAFNTTLGSWEPILEPWTFTLTVNIATEKSGKVSTNIDLSGSDLHSLNLNFSPGLLDTFCTIMKEFEQLSLGSSIHVSTARVISCGFYLANDSGVDISYWVSDHTPATSSSRGFSYNPRHQCVPELLLPRHKVPLKLSTSIFSSIPSDQTISFSWGDEEWHPLTDVRIHSAGKYVYSVLPKHRNLSDEDGKAGDADTSSRKVLLALFDISAVFGYRTLTVSSLVRIFNDTDITVECGMLSEDGKTVTEIGIIEPHDACGVPITLIKSITSIRVLMRPHAPSQDRSAQAVAGGVDRARDEKKYRWSNELFISEQDESSEQFASCSLVLDDYDCKCQRIFDGSQPLHLGQTCRANGSFFRVCSQVFVASNASSLKYAQIRFLPPVVLENKCGLAMHAIFFVFKKVRRAGAQDREYFHIVASEKIEPRSSSYFVASSLHEQTYCSVSVTGFSWSKLFLLPSVFDGTSEQSKGMDTRNRSNSSSTSTEQSGDGSILCFLDDFKSRVATVQVAFHNVNQETHVMRKVIIQPRFVIRDTTSLRLTFEPHAKVKSKISNAKAMFSLSSVSQKRAKTCCGSSQLELIHTKLNALSGASATGTSSLRRQGNTTDQVEIDSYYLSETSAVNIQIEGNTLATSGVSHFRLDSAVGGANSTLRLFDEAKKQWCDIVVILEQLDVGTTKVTFVERYLVLNRTNYHIMCVPASTITSNSTAPNQASSQGSELLPRVMSPFHWSMRTVIPSDACIRLKIRETAGSGGEVTGWRWSGKFSLHDVSETALKLSNKYTNQVHVIRVEVRVESSVRVFVVITSEDLAPFPLYRIVNSSSTEIIHFKQSFEGGSGDLSEQAAATADYNRGVTQRLFPGESLCFGWDEAFFLQSLERTLNITYASATTQTKVLFDQPGDARRIELPGCVTRADAAVYIHWYLNGMTKTVHVHDTELPRDKLTGKQDPATIIANADKTNRVIPVMSELAVHFKLPNMLLSILNSAPEEVLLLSAQDVDLAYADIVSDHDQCEVKVGSIQLDNQMENAIFPVIFTPQPMNGIGSNNILESPRKSSISDAPPSPANSTDDRDSSDCFFHFSIFRLSYGSDVEYIKYLSVMLQPARLQVDDLLVVSIGTLAFDCMRVVQQYFPAEPTRHMSIAIGEAEALSGSRRNRASHSDATPESDESASNRRAQERRMYIETLQLHPIKIILAFQQNDRSSKSVYFDDQTTILLPMVYLLLKSNLVNIDGASLNLNALHIFHSFTTRAFMFSAVQQHYTFQGILQIYALVGAADILGNPLGLVTNLGTGVKDFFYEPAAGMVKSPQEFVMGLSRGTASLVKNSVYGTFNAASKFTGTLSSGIAALSMDNEYVSSRNTRNRQEVATHVGTGLFYGTKQLGQGILAGVTGVITAPAMGAYNNGFTGFVEGVGKGLIGVAVKPTAGILDLAAKTTAGITATATVFDKKARNTRMRLPRMVYTSDRRIRVYSNDEALICQFLHRLPQKLRQNEHYEAHVFLPLGRVLVVTSHQLLHVDVNAITGMSAAGTGQPRITWKFPLASVWGAQKTLKGVHVLIGTATNVVTPGTATTLTRSSMTTVLIPLRADVDAIHVNIVIKCISDLVTRHRERTPVLDTFSAPPPRNSIGLVLEPVRDGSSIPGYEGVGGLVVDVFVGSACFHAGLEVGDVIVGFRDQKMEPGDHGSSLRYQLSLMKKGEALKLMVLRQGVTKTISVSTE